VISSAITGIAHDTDTHNRDNAEPRKRVFMANHPERRVIRQLQNPRLNTLHTSTCSGLNFCFTERVGWTLQDRPLRRQTTISQVQHVLWLCQNALLQERACPRQLFICYIEGR
jgi:hypothetical protein